MDQFGGDNWFELDDMSLFFKIWIEFDDFAPIGCISGRYFNVIQVDFELLELSVEGKYISLV